MSSSNSPQLNVVAFLLAAALERYQAALDRIREEQSDRNLWQEVNHQLGEIRNLAAALPQLAVDQMELLMRHIELLRSAPFSSSGRTELLGKTQEAISSMRQKCLRLLAVDLRSERAVPSAA
jgi:hypothetical protein